MEREIPVALFTHGNRDNNIFFLDFLCVYWFFTQNLSEYGGSFEFRPVGTQKEDGTFTLTERVSVHQFRRSLKGSPYHDMPT